MKKIIFLLILTATQVLAQKRVLSNLFRVTGPIPPINSKYEKATKFALKFNIPPNLSEFLRKNGVNMEEYKTTFKPLVSENTPTNYTNSWNILTVNPPDYQSNLSQISVTFADAFIGLKYNEENPDFLVEYNITRFKYLDSGFDNKAPAHTLGFEANVQIFDRDHTLIYSRYLAPRSNVFLDNPESKLGNTAILALIYHFKNLVTDFSKYYLWQPYLSTSSLQLAKLPKDSDLKDVNLSTAIFQNLSGVNHSERENAFAPAIEYWKSLLSYTTKDKSDKEEIDYVSYYNTALGYILIGKIDEAEKLMPYIIENNKSDRYGLNPAKRLEAILKVVRDTQDAVKELSSIAPIEDEPALEGNKNSNDVFEYMEFNGSAMDKKGVTYEGAFTIRLDDPLKVNFRTIEKSSPAKLLGVFPSDMRVYITVPNTKKPLKRDLSDFIWIKSGEAREYNIIKVGTFLDNDKRYILCQKIDGNSKIMLFKESFPQSNNTFIKKVSDEDPLIINFVTPAKSLKDYFADCPEMNNFIETKQFKSFNSQNKLNKKLLEMYISANCGK